VAQDLETQTPAGWGMKFRAKGTMVLLVAWLVVMAIALAAMSLRDNVPQPDLVGVLRPAPQPLAAFEMIDHRGEAFTVDRFAGKWTFLFFGYTFCPDICPTTLAMLRALGNQLAERGFDDDRFDMLFVSVDPERDTPEQIARYIGFFGERFTGITGNPDEVLSFAKQFGAMYFKEQQTSAQQYLVAHTGSVFLTSPRAELVASFSPPHDPRTIADLFEQVVRTQ
jgi:protein SCO1